MPSHRGLPAPLPPSYSSMALRPPALCVIMYYCAWTCVFHHLSSVSLLDSCREGEPICVCRTGQAGI
jgi:hypothetical protein